MNISEYVPVICLLAICVLSAIYARKENKLKETAKILDRRLAKLENGEKTIVYSDEYIKKVSAQCLLKDLTFRVSKQEVCRQCPLYLNTLRAGTEQTIQPNKE